MTTSPTVPVAGSLSPAPDAKIAMVWMHTARFLTTAAQLHHLPSGHRLAVDDAQFRLIRIQVALVIVDHARRAELRHRISFRHLQQQLAQRRFPDIHFEFRLDAQFVFPVMIREDLRDGDLRQNLVRGNPQRKIRTGKPVATFPGSAPRAADRSA